MTKYLLRVLGGAAIALTATLAKASDATLNSCIRGWTVEPLPYLSYIDLGGVTVTLFRIDKCNKMGKKCTKLTIQTDKYGTYIYNHLEPGNYLVSFTADGYVAAPSAPNQVPLGLGEELIVREPRVVMEKKEHLDGATGKQ